METLPMSVYHVNPLHEGIFPLDMDTADLAGDAFFDLRSKVVPIECSASRANRSWGGDCHNAEVVASDLVITKLSLQVKAARFGEYSRCNICLKDGTDPLSGLPCTPSTYICTCGQFWNPRDCTNETSVGRENITKQFGRFRSYSCNWRGWTDAPWSCWGWSVVAKTGGMWYSTHRAGWCGAAGADPATCTWDAKVEKVVNKSCSDGLIYNGIEKYDRTEGPGCFDACPSHKHHPFRQRNTSDECWIYCYYSTLLGASRLLPSGALPGDTGMPTSRIFNLFEQPFKPMHEGGCPDVTPPAADIRADARARHGRTPTLRPWRLRQRIAASMYRQAALAEAAEAVDA